MLSSGPSNRGPGATTLSALDAAASFGPKAASSLPREEQKLLSESEKYIRGLAEMAREIAAPVDMVLLYLQTFTPLYFHPLTGTFKPDFDPNTGQAIDNIANYPFGLFYPGGSYRAAAIVS